MLQQVFERVLVEHAQELGLRLLQHALQIARRHERARVVFPVEALDQVEIRLRLAHERSDVDLRRWTREPQPAVSSAHGLEEAEADQKLAHLDHVMPRDAVRLGDLGDRDEPVRVHAGMDEHPQRVVREVGQAHAGIVLTERSLLPCVCFADNMYTGYMNSGRAPLENHVTSLYERLGGEPAVSAAVEIFYRRMLTDDRVARFFDGVDLDGQIAKQKGFLTMAFGGPHHYTGKDMRAGHAHLVARGLNDEHVDVVIEHLGATLIELGVGGADVEAVAAIANSVRDDVLGRPAATPARRG